VLPDNPVETLNHSRAWYRIERRRTVIKRTQLPAWYAAVQSLKAPDKPSTSHVIADYLVFMLFTGLRFSEAAELRWDQVDLIERTLSVADPKNREPLELPLTDFLVDLLTERRLMALNEYVFPGRDGKGHLVEPQASNGPCPPGLRDPVHRPRPETHLRHHRRQPGYPPDHGQGARQPQIR
jgi:integrase